MKVHGINKLTLLDYPGKTACTVFTGHCNFRCPFCHNASLVIRPNSQPIMDEDEIFAFLTKRTGVLEGVCLTGGEPTLQRGLREFVSRVKDLGYSVKLDTNGALPNVVEELIDASLVDYVAMDVKNSLPLYPVTIGIEGFDTAPIEESIRLIMDKAPDYEFRTTVVDGFHTVESMLAIGEMIKGARRYFLQSFKDSGDLIDTSLVGVDAVTMNLFRDTVAPYVDFVATRGL